MDASGQLPHWHPVRQAPPRDLEPGRARHRHGPSPRKLRGRSGGPVQFRACAVGLGLVMCVYGMFYVLLERSGEADCPVCHEPLTPATSRLHTEGYHAILRQRWDPSRFHEDGQRWRACVAKPYPGYPALPEDDPTRPVLVWTWHTLENFLYIHPESVESCTVPCMLVAEIENRQECLDEVDGFIFHPPTSGHRPGEPHTKHPHQQWVLFSTESELNYPILDDRPFRSKFDINMTYHLADDVPFTYFIDIDFYTKHWPHPILPKTAEVPVMMMISNCEPKSPRNQYLAELMKHIKIDSYGRCFHNKDIPKEMDGWPWWEVKWNLTSQYKFTIAIENSLSLDYVTEKLFHSFIVGTVPIYLGAPNVEDFTPSEKSVIKVTDFDGPKELAEFLRALDQDDQRYEEYLEWKKTGPAQSFVELQKTSPRTGPCRLCKRIVELQNMIPTERERLMQHHHHRD